MTTTLLKIKFRKSYLKGAVLLAIFSLLLGQIVSPLIAYALSTLYVDISVNPSSGSAPLNNVDLTASVSGSATGDITYKFDCTNDGSWERTQTTSSTSYTATDLCDYSSVGNYTARISVEREGLVFYGTTAIFVSGGSDLYANLYANPSSGSAPLNNVDLTATVSGAATGSITYKFDCTNNGSWERTITTSSTSYTATDLCDYPAAGSYTAKVSVERGGLSFQGTAGIAVHGPSDGDTSLVIQKLARNVTKGQTSFSQIISANPGDILEFYIEISSSGNKTAENVIVSDVLPNKITFSGNLKIDGLPIVGAQNVAYGRNLGDLAPGQKKIMTFEAKVASEENFGFGLTSLTNTGMAHATNVSAVTNTARVDVVRTAVAGAATVVGTGSNYLYYSLLMVFILSMGFYLFSFLAEHSQNRFAKRILRKYYMFKSFALPR